MLSTRLEKKHGVAILTAVMVAAGCGGGGDSGGGGEMGGGGAMESPVDPATAGNASGRVTFTGSAPMMPEIDMSDEATCASQYSMTPTAETVMVGANGGLANVFVYLREGLENLDFPTPSQAVVIDQHGCRYHPHVLGVQAGQNMTVRNSDGLLHNINASPTENRPFNVSQPVNMDTQRSFAVAEVMIPVRCDVHSWMNAYIGVVDNPYYAVSDETGAVSLEGLPPGDYVVEAWHERYGTLTQNITIATGQTAELSFEFNESMAGRPVPMGEPIDLMHLEGHRTADHQDPQ